MSDKKGTPAQMTKFVKLPERKVVFWPPKDDKVKESFDPEKWIDCDIKRAPIHPDFLEYYDKYRGPYVSPNDREDPKCRKARLQRKILRDRDSRPFHLILELYGYEAMMVARSAVNKYLCEHKIVDQRFEEQEEEKRRKKEEEERKKEEERRKMIQKEEDELDLFKKFGITPTHCGFPPDLNEGDEDFEMKPIKMGELNF